jgi:hypothetical protein
MLILPNQGSSAQILLLLLCMTDHITRTPQTSPCSPTINIASTGMIDFIPISRTNFRSFSDLVSALDEDQLRTSLLLHQTERGEYNTMLTSFPILAASSLNVSTIDRPSCSIPSVSLEFIPEYLNSLAYTTAILLAWASFLPLFVRV